MSKSEQLCVDLMILGFEKAGTTALFKHIAQSPKVFTHSQREMFYFFSDEEYARGWGFAQKKYLSANDGCYVVAKNVMQIGSTKAMVRLKEQCPGVKCVVMLREPASRAYSAYNYARMRGVEDSSTFEEALGREERRSLSGDDYWRPTLYIRNSTYAPQLQKAMEIYGKENVLVFFQEEYEKDPLTHLLKVEDLLGISFFDGVELNAKKHNRAAKARFPWLSRFVYRFIRSKGLLRQLLRLMLPHQFATSIKHGVLNFNRIETENPPMREDTALQIRHALIEDSALLSRLVGRCPWT